MTNLNELATRLQSYIINSQRDAHNGRNFSKSRYNNLKIKISSSLEYPNIIISIGISEATYNIEDGTKTDGSLGPDEKYVYKWIGNKNIQPILKELYLSMTELVDLEEEQNELKDELDDEFKIDMEGFAGESKIDDRPDRRSKRNNFRKLMMPSQVLMHEDDENHKRETLLRREDVMLTPLETVSAEYEEYNAETDLEIYEEQEQLESLENASKKHNLMNFFQNTFGNRHTDDEDE